MEPIITKYTVKVLKFIKRYPNCSFQKIQEKFTGIDYMELVNLALTGYLVCTKADGTLTDFSNTMFQVNPDDLFWASPKTIQHLEERFQRRWQWVVPTVISAFALILSIAAFIVSLLPTVTEVRIVP